MALGQGGLQFPFDQYLASRQASDPRAVAGQALGGINLPQILDFLNKEKQKSVLSQALASMRTGQIPPADPSLGQPTAGLNNTFQKPQQPVQGGFSPDVMNALLSLGGKDNTELAGKALLGGMVGDSDLMYTPEQATAIANGDIEKFNLLNQGQPVQHKTLSLIGTGQYRQGINDRFGKNMDWRSSVEWQNIAEGFNKDAGVKNARESLAGADKVLRLADMQSALGDEALGFLVPRALEEVGNLAQAERTAVRISPNLVNKAKSLVQRNFGPGTTLTLRDRADLKEIMLAFRKVQELKLDKMQEYYAGQASENFGIPLNLAKKRLGDMSKLTVRIDDVAPPPPVLGGGKKVGRFAVSVTQ